jgi:hypothetical protein
MGKSLLDHPILQISPTLERLKAVCDGAYPVQTCSIPSPDFLSFTERLVSFASAAIIVPYHDNGFARADSEVF